MAKVNLTPDDLAKCELAKAILQKDLSKHYTNSELARKVGTNEKKLKVGFKLITGNTVWEFVTKLRIEKAKELLETTHLPIEVIANRLGLDHSNLIKQFKKSTGIKPKDWRNNSRNIRTDFSSG